MLNKVILIGNLGKDPDGKKTGNGDDAARFSLATRSSRKGDDGKNLTEWFSVQAFGHTAKYVLQYCGKGSKVYVEGELQSYESEKYGKQYSVLARSIQGLSTEKPAPRAGLVQQPTQQQDPFSDDVPW